MYFSIIKKTIMLKFQQKVIFLKNYLEILKKCDLFKNINESNITERLGKLEVSMMKEMGDFKNDLNYITKLKWWFLIGLKKK